MSDPTLSSRSRRVPRGTRLNGVYEIEALIAEGGMGEVYRGRTIQTGDPVAIKMILPDLSENPDALGLFRREASMLHTLAHDAIVRYFVFSIDPDLGRAYLAMEFVDGPSLSTRLQSGPLDISDVRHLQRRLAEGLHAAHRLGIIHRDISPDNVILPEGDVRRAKIIDFGIARSTRSTDGTIIGGGFAGKYNWVSPEQLGLAGGKVTPKSDIYSLGLVLAAALQGRAIDMGGTQLEVIEKRRRLPDLADVDPWFVPLIEAMLQPDPAARPATMAEVAAYGRNRVERDDDEITLVFPEPGATRAPGAGTTRPPMPPAPTAPPQKRGGSRPLPGSGPERQRSRAGLVLALIAGVAVIGGGAYFGLPYLTEARFGVPETPPLSERPPQSEGPAVPRPTLPGLPESPGSGGAEAPDAPTTGAPSEQPGDSGRVKSDLPEVPPLPGLPAPGSATAEKPTTEGAEAPGSTTANAPIPEIPAPDSSTVPPPATPSTTEAPSSGQTSDDAATGPAPETSASAPEAAPAAAAATDDRPRPGLPRPRPDPATLNRPVAVTPPSDGPLLPPTPDAGPPPVVVDLPPPGGQSAATTAGPDDWKKPLSADSIVEELLAQSVGLPQTSAGPGPGSEADPAEAADPPPAPGDRPLPEGAGPVASTAPALPPSSGDEADPDNSPPASPQIGGSSTAASTSGTPSPPPPADGPSTEAPADAGGALAFGPSSSAEAGTEPTLPDLPTASSPEAPGTDLPSVPPLPPLPEPASPTRPDASRPASTASQAAAGAEADPAESPAPPLLAPEPAPDRPAPAEDAATPSGDPAPSTSSATPPAPSPASPEPSAPVAGSAPTPPTTEPKVAALPPDAVPAIPTNRAPDAGVASFEASSGTIGRSYLVTLPAFRDPDPGDRVKLSVDGALPPGLNLYDAGGTGRLTGIPTTPGDYAFTVAAADAEGATARLSVRLHIEPQAAPPPAPTTPTPTPTVEAPVPQPSPAAPAETSPATEGPPPEPSVTTPPPPEPEVAARPPDEPPASPTPSPAPPAPTDLASYLRAFDGGSCFFARPLGSTAEAPHIEGFGVDVAPFQKLESSLLEQRSIEPRIEVRPVAQPQCPAIEFMDLVDGADRPPQLTLDRSDVGPGRPLTGTITGLGDRSLALVLVGNDGSVVSLDRFLKTGPGRASFSVPLSADAASEGQPQLLLAIAARGPLEALEEASRDAASLFAHLTGEVGRRPDAISVDAELFRIRTQ